MIYQYSHRLGAYAPGFDPEAKAIINAITTAGGTLTGAQKKAIDTFVKTGDSQGWYSLLKRFYLPVWGAAGPNAVDWIARGSGTFVGTVTHGAGFVQGDGSTGYFSGNASFTSVLGTTQLAHGWIISIEDTAGSDLAGGIIGPNRLWLGAVASTVNQIVIGRNTINASITSAYKGIFVGSRESSTSLILHRRSAGTNTTSATTTTSNDLNIPNVTPFYAGAYSTTGTPTFAAAPAKQGGYGFGTPMTTTQAQNFSAALETMFNTITGLTL
jgi:hypothetical protein